MMLPGKLPSINPTHTPRQNQTSDNRKTQQRDPVGKKIERVKSEQFRHLLQNHPNYRNIESNMTSALFSKEPTLSYSISQSSLGWPYYAVSYNPKFCRKAQVIRVTEQGYHQIRSPKTIAQTVAASLTADKIKTTLNTALKLYCHFQKSVMPPKAQKEIGPLKFEEESNICQKVNELPMRDEQSSLEDKAQDPKIIYSDPVSFGDQLRQISIQIYYYSCEYTKLHTSFESLKSELSVYLEPFDEEINSMKNSADDQLDAISADMRHRQLEWQKNIKIKIEDLINILNLKACNIDHSDQKNSALSGLELLLIEPELNNLKNTLINIPNTQKQLLLPTISDLISLDGRLKVEKKRIKTITEAKSIVFLLERMGDYEIESAMQIKVELDKLATKRQEMQKKIKKLKEFAPPISSNFIVRLNAAVNLAIKAEQNLTELTSSDRFHLGCSLRRAKQLLSERSDASYMLHSRENFNYLCLSYVDNGKIFHIFLRVWKNGLCSKFPFYRQQKFKELLTSIFSDTRTHPLPNRPYEHALAQCEWNTTDLPKILVDKSAQLGISYLKHSDEGLYRLDYQSNINGVKSYAIKVKEGKFYGKFEDQEHTSESLYKLLTECFAIPYNLQYNPSEKNKTLIEKFYYRTLLPMMEKANKLWIKASRRQYTFLEHSLWVNYNGGIYEQWHKSSLNEDRNFIKNEKKLIGKGSVKRIWQLKPLYSQSPPMVRASFIDNLPISIPSQIETIALLKSQVKSPFLLLPTFVSYYSSNNRLTFAQVMPLMEGGDLEQAHEKRHFTLLTCCKIMRDIGSALIEMHSHNWVHADIKPTNILLSSSDYNNCTPMLADFDFAAKVDEDSSSYRRPTTPYFSDPACWHKCSVGLKGALLHDQFSFGATLYFLCTGAYLRDGAKNVSDLVKWVTEEDLQQDPSFKTLPSLLQNIIRSFCIGDLTRRGYYLPKCISLINNYIKEFK